MGASLPPSDGAALGADGRSAYVFRLQRGDGEVGSF